jgi:hypothetical protein
MGLLFVQDWIGPIKQVVGLLVYIQILVNSRLQVVSQNIQHIYQLAWFPGRSVQAGIAGYCPAKRFPAPCACAD